MFGLLTTGNGHLLIVRLDIFSAFLIKNFTRLRSLGSAHSSRRRTMEEADESSDRADSSRHGQQVTSSLSADKLLQFCTE